jgi:hypothetical protein
MENKRKRGRPRKIVNVKKVEPEEDDNIVLFLDIDSDDDTKVDDNKKKKMDKKEELELESKNDTKTPRFVEDDNSEDSIEDLEKLSKKNKKSIAKLERNINNNSNNSSNKDLEKLLEVIKKKDRIIMKLKMKVQDKGIKNNDNIKKSKINYNCVQVRDINSCKDFSPQKTNLKCWQCDYKFDTLPCYLPNSYKNNKFYVYGNFCSFNCALKYNNSGKKDYMTNTRNALLHKLKYKITEDDSPIVEAQDRELLESKGGKMGIDEYRRNFVVNKLKVNMSMPPLIPLIHTIEKTISD